MAREKIDLIGNLAIIQGETYRSLTLEFPGDLTGHTARGQIRTALLQDEGTLLAEFYFDAPAYDAGTDSTTIYPYLTPGQTSALLKTKYQGTGEITKRNIYYYDIELELAGAVTKTFPAIVQVVGEVTDENLPPTYPDPIDWLRAEDIGTRVLGDAPSDGNQYTREDGQWVELPAAVVGITDHEQLSNIGTLTHDELETELAGKEPADPTILKDADIGVTVQEYNPNTVIDPGYVATEENYTTAEKGKLAGIQPGAEVNVNADWNAIGGDAEILNKPTLGSAAATDSTDYATAAQGIKADSAVQPSGIAEFETTTQLNARDTANRLWGNLTNIPGWITGATTFGQSLITAASASAAKALLALTKSDVGLGNVDNVSDIDKPISTATQTALDSKQSTLVSGTNIKTLNSESLLGSGNIVIGAPDILPNNVRINGVEHFYQSAKPTVRGDGSALVAGDRWINDRGTLTWDGLIWADKPVGIEAVVFRIGFGGVTLTGDVSTTFHTSGGFSGYRRFNTSADGVGTGKDRLNNPFGGLIEWTDDILPEATYGLDILLSHRVNTGIARVYLTRSDPGANVISDRGFGIQINTDLSVIAQMWKGGGVGLIESSAGSMPTNIVTHVYLHYSNGVYRVFISGVLVATITDDFGASFGIPMLIFSANINNISGAGSITELHRLSLRRLA